MSYYYSPRGMGSVETDCGTCVNPLVAAIIADAVKAGSMPDPTRLRAAYLGCGGHELSGGGFSCATPEHQAAADAAAAVVAAQLAAAQHTPASVLAPPAVPSATLAVAGRSGNTFGTDDSYTVTVTGPPNLPVTATLNGSAAAVVGSTDSAGRWSVSGNWLHAAGAYVETYYVGGVFAGTFTFTVLDVSAPAAGSKDSTCAPGYSYVASSTSCVKDPDKPADKPPAADAGAMPAFLSGSVGGVPVWLIAAGGLAFLFSKRGGR